MTESKNIPDVSIFRPVLIVSGLIIIMAAMRAASTVVATLFFIFFIALFFLPFKGWLIRKRVPSWLAVLIIITILIFVIAGILGLLYISSNQLYQNIFTEQANLESYLDNLQDELIQLGISPADLGLTGDGMGEQISGAISGIVPGILGSGFTWFTIAIVIFVAVIMLLAEAEGYIQRLRDSVGENNPAFAALRGFARDLMGWLIARGQVNVIVTIAVVILLLALNVNGALIWAVMTFFLGFIPFLGLAIAALLPALLTFVQQGLTSALLLGLGYFVISTISENILWPKFLGRGLNMSAAYILVSAFVFGWLMGIPGILLSGPLSVFLLLVLSLFKETSWITNMIVTRQQPEIPEEN